MAKGAPCQPSDADGVCSSDHWRVIVNHNQNRLRKCMICLKRHDKDICNLSGEKVRDLWPIIRGLRVALMSCFQPNHFNNAVLMNQDAHIQLHVTPRYRGSRTFAGTESQDSDAITEQGLPGRVQRQIVSALKEALRIDPR